MILLFQRWDTVDGQNIQTLDNFTHNAPQISKLLSSSKGWDGWTKEIEPPKHDMSRTRCLTLTFGDEGVMPIFSSGFEYILSIYGILQ